MDFNGGDGCVQMYVSQHEFFISKDRVEELNTVENDKL
jgi:exocyst complex component 5